MITLYVVVPCYNESEVLNETAKRLLSKFQSLDNKITIQSRILFVNDGSNDNTWEIIKNLHEQNRMISGISLSRNQGHQNALLAGLLTAKDYCDAAISMDADLQDDVNVIDKMLDKFAEGSEIVYGVRSKRTTDSLLKRFTAESFYKLMNVLGANTIYNHADYRLMSRRALNALAEFKEVNLFLRGIIPMIGFQNSIVYYERSERFAGKSKYPFKKMLAFAFEGITSLSTKPIRIITLLGGCVSAISILMFLWSIITYFKGVTIPGWASIMVSIWVIGGLLLLSVGIVGEYVGKIYLETKGRPRYIIEQVIDDNDMNEGKQDKPFEL